jgi:hypothetical protein
MKYRLADAADISDFRQILLSFHIASGIPAVNMDLDSHAIVASAGRGGFEDLDPFKDSPWHGQE